MSSAAIAPSTEPVSHSTGIAEEARQKLSKSLEQELCDTYVLMGKTHGFHWNVTGPRFHSLHEMFEEQYKDLFEAVDDVAERIRALGFYAPGSLSHFKRVSSISDEQGVPDADGMLRELVEDHETTVRACREVIEVCDDTGDTVTEDLMNGRIAAHEKNAWMLRASMTQQSG